MERIININGVLYVARENENGIYMQRVNADGSNWEDKPQLNEAERASGIVVGPTKIVITEKKQPWYKRFLGR